MSASVIPFSERLVPRFPSPGYADSPIIIGFAGVIGVGKSTAAELLERRHGFARTRFAAPLKAMLRAFLLGVAAGEDEINRMIEGDLKETPSPYFCGRTPRQAMQTLGTEWGRDCIGGGLWTHAWQTGVRKLIGYGVTRICVEDVRFDNEFAAISELGGRVYRIERASAAIDAHVSERSITKPMASIRNDGAIEDLARRLAQTIGGL